MKPALDDAERSFADLELRQDNLKNLDDNGIILFCTLRNESVRVPYFLDYYRRLGVSHFMFVDNGSTDGFELIVSDNDDVTVWHTTASYKATRFGMDWLNALLARYGVGRWCVTCDPDEFLVYPYSDTRDLVELTTWLDTQSYDSLHCLLLDMYSREPVHEAIYNAGQDPLDVCPFYDPTGYRYQYSEHGNNLWIQGGPRMRAMFHDDPGNAPALNKIPLVKWKKNYCYLSSMHMLGPRRLNNAHKHDHVALTGALLHFKFFSSLKHKAEEELQRKEHYAGSREYQRYHADMKQDSLRLYHEGSAEYQTWRDLLNDGLITTGPWC